MKKDGTNNTLIINENIGIVGISGDSIYYEKWMNSSADIYKMSLKDSKKSLVMKDVYPTTQSLIIENYLYCPSDASGSLTLERLNMNDFQITSLYKFNINSNQKISILGDYISFYDYKNASDSETELYKIKNGSTTIEKVNSGL